MYVSPGPQICASRRSHSGLQRRKENIVSHDSPNKNKVERAKRKGNGARGGRGIEKVERQKPRGNSLVDAIRVVLSLDSDAAAADDLLVDALDALGALEVGGAVHPVARVEDDAGLVGAQLGGDAREGAREADDDGVVGRLVLDQKVAVVALAGAVGSAVALEAGLVPRVPDRQVRRRRKVVDRPRLRRQYLARRKRPLVRLQVPLRVGQVQPVVPDLGRVRVPVRVQVEVGVLSEQEGCYRSNRRGLINHACQPSFLRC